MKIIGIDPGLATIGIGLIEAMSKNDIEVLDWFTIETQAGEETPNRLTEIAKDLENLLEEHKPELAVVEKIFFAKNEKSAIDVAQARGVILQVLASRSITIIEPTPIQIKSVITGDGRADKKQIQDMLVLTLNLQEAPKPDDAADAIAMALYGAFVNM